MLSSLGTLILSICLTVLGGSGEGVPSCSSSAIGGMSFSCTLDAPSRLPVSPNSLWLLPISTRVTVTNPFGGSGACVNGRTTAARSART